MSKRTSSTATLSPTHDRTPADGPSEPAQPLVLRHLRFGWWSLLVFLSLGIVLESLHAFKVGWYLDTSHETRRLMFTLAHAHGTFLSLVHMAFAATLALAPLAAGKLRTLASGSLLGASIALPAGFFLSGVYAFSETGDPGLAIVLVPVGAVLLLSGVLSAALGLRRARS
jgi:hypothetical protein